MQSLTQSPQPYNSFCSLGTSQITFGMKTSEPIYNLTPCEGESLIWNPTYIGLVVFQYISGNLCTVVARASASAGPKEGTPRQENAMADTQTKNHILSIIKGIIVPLSLANKQRVFKIEINKLNYVVFCTKSNFFRCQIFSNRSTKWMK